VGRLLTGTRMDTAIAAAVALDAMKVLVLASLIAVGGTVGTTSPTTISNEEKVRFPPEFRFGKCVGELCGRFGIKESTGGTGFGAGVRLLEHRLSLWPEFRQSPGRALAPAEPRSQRP
jgi:hypothetical protein